MVKYINLNGIGFVRMYSSNRAKRIIIYIRKNNEVRVAIPKNISIDNAKEFDTSISLSEEIYINLTKILHDKAVLSGEIKLKGRIQGRH